MILQVLDITAPVFALAAIGYIWARRGVAYDLDFATRLGTQLAVPCLIFSTLSRADISAAALGEFFWATLALYGALAVIFAGTLRLAGLKLRTHLPSAVFNNTGNLGLPVALYAYGEPGLALAIVLFALMATLQFSLGLWFIAGAEKGREALRQPMVWAAALGLLAALTGVEPPAIADRILALIGQIAIPLMLLTLGVSISRIRAASIRQALAISIHRYAVAIAAALAVGVGLGLGPVAFGVLMIQAAMPAPITNYLIALKYDAEPEEVASVVVVSTALSIIFIPLTLAFLL